MKNIKNQNNNSGILPVATKNCEKMKTTVCIGIIAFLTIWATAIAVGLYFYYSGRYTEEWLHVAVWLNFGAFVAGRLSFVFESVVDRIGRRHDKVRKDQNKEDGAAGDNQVELDEKLAELFGQYQDSQSDPAVADIERQVMSDMQIRWCNKLHAFVVFVFLPNGDRTIVGRVQIEKGRDPGLTFTWYRTYMKIAREIAHLRGFYFANEIDDETKDEPAFHVGQCIYLEHVQGKPEENGKMGLITSIDENGTIYGTWGDCGIVYGIDSFIGVDK